jgi:C4-dicarboxylate transporter DctM subunit
MPITAVLIIALVCFLALIVMRVPVAFSLMSAGSLGIIFLSGPSLAFKAISSAPYTAVGNYDLLVLPMFILLGAIVSHSGIATAIFGSVNKLFGWLPGGLAAATVAACCIFGGISGSSAADAATIGRISVDEMRKHGYDVSFAAGLVAASGAIAILIPPSIPIVIYGIITGLPINSLLIAGLLPGILSGVLFAVYAIIRSKIYPPKVTVDKGKIEKLSASGGRRDFLGLIYALLLFLIIIGGMYTGYFTTTEAAAVGAFTAAVLAVPVVRMHRKDLKSVYQESIIETAKLSSMIFALLIGTAVFTYFLAITRVPIQLTEWISSSGFSVTTVVLAFLALLIVLGMFLDGLSMMLLTIPIAFPVFQNLGVDGIWLGILVVVTIEIGLLTPPVGINVFVIAGVVKGLRLEDAFRGVIPFIFIKIIILGLLFMFPDIVLILPRLAE